MARKDRNLREDDTFYDDDPFFAEEPEKKTSPAMRMWEKIPALGREILLAVVALAAVAVAAVFVMNGDLEPQANAGTNSGKDQQIFHRHSWIEADCVTPKTCRDCGEAQGEALGHSWQVATCTSPAICVNCGKTEGAALGHSWADTGVLAPQSCERCGETQPGNSEDDILDQAAQYARAGDYRLAIQLLDTAWEEYGLASFRDAASDYRTQFGNYHGTYVAAGKYNSILRYPDGTVDIVGDNDFGELKADSWQNIVCVSSGDRFTVGLRADGTVVGKGDRDYRQYTYAEDWENVIAISAGDFHTVGLLEGGIVVSSTTFNHCGEANVERLMSAAGSREIVSISAGYDHTLALLEDGTVVACGDKSEGGNRSNGVCDVSGWNNIAAIYSGTEFCAGLKTDGTVVVAGVSWDLSDWTDISSLAAGDYFLVGLKSDGTVLYQVNEQMIGEKYDRNSVQKMYYVTGWTDIVHIAAGHDHIIGIRSDGTVVCAGGNGYGQCSQDGAVIDLNG